MLPFIENQLLFPWNFSTVSIFSIFYGSPISLIPEFQSVQPARSFLWRDFHLNNNPVEFNLWFFSLIWNILSLFFFFPLFPLPFSLQRFDRYVTNVVLSWEITFFFPCNFWMGVFSRHFSSKTKVSEFGFLRRDMDSPFRNSYFLGISMSEWFSNKIRWRSVSDLR